MVALVVLALSGSLISALMLALGLETDLKRLGQLRARPGLFLRAFAAIELGVPLFTIAAVGLFAPPRLAMGVMLLMAVCPGVPLLARTVRRQGGSMDTAVNLVLVLALAAPLTVALWVKVLAHVYDTPLRLSAAQALAVVGPKMLLPFALGVALRALLPRFAAPLGRAVNVLFLAGMLCAGVLLLLRGLPLMRQVDLRTLVALLLVVTASALLGHQVGGPRHEDRVAVGIAAVFGNPALALAIAKESFSSAPALPLIAAFLLLRTLALLPYLRWARAQGTRARPLPPGAVTP